MCQLQTPMRCTPDDPPPLERWRVSKEEEWKWNRGGKKWAHNRKGRGSRTLQQEFPRNTEELPETNSAGEASRSSLGTESSASITQGKRSTEITVRNAALSKLWKHSHKPLAWRWYTVVQCTCVPSDFATQWMRGHAKPNPSVSEMLALRLSAQKVCTGIQKAQTALPQQS